MKKILHIPKYYPPHTGGIEDVCYNIVHYLAENNKIEQQIICFDSGNETIYDYYEGVKVTRIGCFKKIASQSLSIKYRHELNRLLEDFDPDIIHFHAPNPLITCYLLFILPPNVKLIVHWHSDIVAQKILYHFFKPIERKLLQRADVILATSPNYIKKSKPLQEFCDKIIVLPNIINPEKFDYTEKTAKKVHQIRKFYSNKPIILFVGRHVPYKGLQYLLEATAKITNDCEIIIGGQGPLTDKLKKYNNALNIHFVGRIDDNELAAYYYAADIFVFPSITKNEAFGVVLAEAMYCNTPAITFTIEGSGVNWVNLNGHTGIEVDNSDSHQLAFAINNLLVNNSLRKEYALNARLRVEKLFVIDCIKEGIAELYS